MSAARQLHINVHLHENGHHEAAWRLPESDPLVATDFEYFVNLAKLAERGTVDGLFFGDILALIGNPKYRPWGLLEPMTLVTGLAARTEKIGLIATASTTYKEPYDLARQLATLDHVSHGRIGWNIVTTIGDDSARNFGREASDAHGDRYDRADEFVEVITKLWDSWEDDAPVGDKASGIFADTEKIHRIDYRGQHFKVAGPLNVPRGPQGWPVLVQAGSSPRGRDFAGRWAEVVFTAQRTIAEGQEFYSDIKTRARAWGRRPDQVVILPGLVTFLGSTEAEAKERRESFEELMSPEYGLTQLSSLYGVDLTGIDLDGPLPEVPYETEATGMRSRVGLITNVAREDGLTVRELLRKLGGGRGHRQFTGTPEQLADDMERWFVQGAADGFNLQPAALPGELEVIVDEVIPILRRRGLFRTQYTGSTLREHYGLDRPANRLGADRP